ncbi:MAG TPA: chitinase [Micromonosporaceae bacterium]|nr:chitinase [Micromonosporaceae bacterium]
MRKKVFIAAVLVAALLPVPAHAAPTRYEAETAPAVCNGTIDSNHLGFSGTGFCNANNAVGGYAEWTVNAASAGTATIGIRYANGTTANRPADISVNGTVVQVASAFNPTGAWATWATKTLTASVNAGSNTIRVAATTATGPANLDFLEVEMAAADPDFQAENAVISQGVVESNHVGFTGTGFVNYNNVSGSYVEFAVNSPGGTFALEFRYANGTTINRPVTVNGIALDFPGTGAWTTWQTRTMTISLQSGTNLIRATATTANGGPNLDRLRVFAVEGEPPTVPQNPRVTGTTSSSISLAWDPSSDNVGVTGYKVYEGNTVVASPTGTTATITGLAPSTSHTYTISARDAMGNESAKSVPVTGTTQAGGVPGMAAAPYEYFGWASPQDPVTVMNVTGIKWFTLAFILSDGGCNPAWDGSRPLTGGNDQNQINRIRANGGDVMVSIGGWSGNKLGERCSSASALAGAYQKVINAYNLKVIDIDIENTEWNNATVRQRVIDALKIVKQNNPGVKTIITFGTTVNGPDATGRDMINRGAASGLANDVWAVMPFDFGGYTGDMGDASISAVEGLKAAVQSAYGYSDAVTYAHIGLSSMNGKTDVPGETVTVSDFQQILTYARQKHLARFAFWSINRDRPCGGGTDPDACSGIPQQPYDFTKIIAQYQG